MSGDLIVIQNCMSHQGMRNLHVMSNQVIDQDQVLRRFAQSPNPYRLQVQEEEHDPLAFHFRATWLAREAMYFRFPQWTGYDGNYPVVVWALEAPIPGPSPECRNGIQGKGEVQKPRIRDAAVDAALMFYGTFGYWPSAAWVRTWPNGLALLDGVIPVTEEIRLSLIDVRWAMEAFVIVGGSFNRRS